MCDISTGSLLSTYPILHFTGGQDREGGFTGIVHELCVRLHAVAVLFYFVATPRAMWHPAFAVWALHSSLTLPMCCAFSPLPSSQHHSYACFLPPTPALLHHCCLLLPCMLFPFAFSGCYPFAGHFAFSLLVIFLPTYSLSRFASFVGVLVPCLVTLLCLHFFSLIAWRDMAFFPLPCCICLPTCLPTYPFSLTASFLCLLLPVTP